MSFNQGFLCPNCGPVQDSKERSINKVKHPTCKTCEAIVSKWERPLNERAGRCGNCAAASFKSAIVKGHLVRNCVTCQEVYDIDANKIIRKGKEEFRYEPNKRNG